VKDLNTLQLSYTSTGSVAGVYINMTAQTATGGGTFTLTSTTFAGTYSWKYQGSNDGSNFFDLSVSSVTYSAPGNTEWEGPVYCRWLRVKFTAGTGGGLKLKILGNGKRKS
jgi:hypothetical protein